MGKQVKKIWLLPLFICTIMSFCFLTSCADDDKNGPDNTSSIVGKWGMEGYIDGDYVISTLELKKDGKAIIEEKFRDYPEDNYKVVVNYTIDGDVATGAKLFLSGKDADGEEYSQNYIATISGNKLTLVGIGGESNGVHLVFTRK